jgi:hypothetical protein
MDDTLVILFGELCRRIEECQEKNPALDLDDLMRSCLLIQSYLDGFKKEAVSEEKPVMLSPIMYEEISILTRPPRVIPKGHVGPSQYMARYAEEHDNINAKLVDNIIQYGKDLENNKNVPFF